MGEARTTLSFLRAQWRFLLFGLLLSFFSFPGQTFFISLFSAEIRGDLGLSHGGFGAIYALGTLASAATILPLGRLVDTIRLPLIATAISLGLAAAAGFFAMVLSVPMLVLGIYFLRLSGQGMMTHLSATAMARRYDAERGRALAIAALGNPLGEFLMPLVTISLLLVLPWRSVWLLMAAAVLLVMLPVIWQFSGRRAGQDGGGVDAMAAGRDGLHWTRREMLLHWRFWLLTAAVISPSFTITGLFFHQLWFAEQKQVGLAFWGGGYAFYASFSIAGSLLAGLLVDRLSASRLLAPGLLLLPLTVLLLWLVGNDLSLYLYFTVFGLAAGSLHTMNSAIWAEIYGTRHLGGIKAIAQAVMVFASALSPLMLGLMIDAGLGLAVLLLALGLISGAAAVLAYFGTRRG